MHFTSFIALAASLSLTWASPTNKLHVRNEGHVLHEKRNVIPDGWAHSHKLHRDTVLPMRIAMAQANMDKIEDYLMSVSDPNSPQWGQHWTSKQVAETFAPSDETVDTLRAWLASAGISADRISRSGSLGWLTFDAKVHEAEALLKTEYHMYEHDTGARQVNCDKYHVPAAVRQHIGMGWDP
jgi:tripeptidyl-peptidase-1